MKAFFRFVLVFVLFFCGTLVLAYKFSPPGKCEHPFRSCMANQRVLRGAIEMYNMDHTNTLKGIKKDDYMSKAGLLLEGKYLKEPLEMPDKNCLLIYRTDKNNEFEIYCKKHGSVENPIPEKPSEIRK